MSHKDVPGKPKRKNVNVPVHKDHISCKKTFAANFNSNANKKPSEDQNVHANIILEIPESDRSGKIKKKHLIKENQRLYEENKETVARFHELEELSVKKITRLKDKIASLEKLNEKINKTNEELREQSKELLESHQILAEQVEALRICDSCERFKQILEECTQENELIKNSNKELNSDLDMLKTVIYRLNVQLDRYQETLRRNNLNITLRVLEDTNQKTSDSGIFDTNRSKEIIEDIHKNHKHTPVSWGDVNSHTLGPLLDAYEDTIKEKEEIIQNYESELYNFSGKMKNVMEENEELIVKLSEDEGCSAKLRIEMEKIKTELTTTKQQNDSLIKKCALKQDKVEEILKVYESRVNQLKHDLDVLHGEYMKVRAENAGFKEKNNSFLEMQEEFKKRMQEYVPLSAHTASVDNCKKWYEELKQQYKTETEKLLETTKQHLKIIDDLKNEMKILNSTKESLQHVISSQEKNVKKLEAKYLEIHHKMNEVQLSKSALRKQLHKAMNFAKDMVAEQETLLRALNQRQMENKVVKKIGTEMATKMDSLKSHLKDVQKNAWQEFNTVEQTIQEQTNLIETMKKEHGHEIEKLTKIIKQHQQANLFPNKDNLPMSQFVLFKEKYK